MELWFTPVLSSQLSHFKRSRRKVKEMFTSESKHLISVHVKKYPDILLRKNIFVDLKYRLFLLQFKNPEEMLSKSITGGTFFLIQWPSYIHVNSNKKIHFLQ